MTKQETYFNVKMLKQKTFAAVCVIQRPGDGRAKGPFQIKQYNKNNLLSKERLNVVI